MHQRCPSTRLHVLTVAVAGLLAAGCTGSGDSDGESGGTASPSGPTATSSQPAGTVEGREQEIPPPDASFPASTAEDSGDPQPGASEAGEAMQVAGVQLTHHDGYDRVVVDLSTPGVPFWTARYSEASSPVGDPVEIAGDAYLRLGLFTESHADRKVEPVRSESGVVAEVRATGSMGGYQEVLIGVRGGAAPFRAFALTDPGRLVVDIRAAG
ncbi:AMIN-like domain-containing (lipo)protein [Blastococcus saxobsidens]|uniref:AMIN-like domain-containing protein n=1 Tax=Blastococcus saxobsidens (strain DD2) TaxID=1146883 RepID=H6RL12_BLASD|nr:hypothetical protein [Blastococcus saxobsidens]CCG04979.1 conserved exported protein of unknown function [Blastococcus saxobsidens DD2]